MVSGATGSNKKGRQNAFLLIIFYVLKFYARRFAINNVRGSNLSLNFSRFVES